MKICLILTQIVHAQIFVPNSPINNELTSYQITDSVLAPNSRQAII